MRMGGRLANTAVQLALRDATLAEPLVPLLQGWMPLRQRIGRWVAHESLTHRGAIDDLLIGCGFYRVDLADNAPLARTRAQAWVKKRDSRLAPTSA